MDTEKIGPRNEPIAHVENTTKGEGETLETTAKVLVQDAEDTANLEH